jgi:hypothetical protein
MFMAQGMGFVQGQALSRDFGYVVEPIFRRIKKGRLTPLFDSIN